MISFIIPHKGRPEMLEATIASIKAQEFDMKQVEILVMTQDKSNGLAGPVSCTALHVLTHITDGSGATRTPNIGAMRNRGAKEAKGRYLAFLDADVKLSPNWLKVMLEELETHSSRVLISAVQVCEFPESKVEEIQVHLSQRKADQVVHSLDARNLFLTKETFEKVGGFPKHLETCEDVYFINRISELGEAFVTSRATYKHLGEDRSYRELFQKEIWRSHSNFKSMIGRRVPLVEIPSLMLPFWMLTFLVGLLLSLSLQLWGWGVVTLTALLLPVIFYAFRSFLRRSAGIGLFDYLKFYCVYCSSRTIGSIKGLVVELFRVTPELFVMGGSTPGGGAHVEKRRGQDRELRESGHE